MSRDFKFHLITSSELSPETLFEMALEAERAGVDYFQLRAKEASPRELLANAKEIRARLKNTKFIVNGQLDVGLAANADGIHLQKGNIPVASIRAKYPRLFLGYSAHSLDEMRHAESDGADYVFLSPIFSPVSKKSTATPVGISALLDWTKQIKIPVFALGGISTQNLSEVKRSGCAGAAGISLFLKEQRFSAEAMVE